MFEYKKKKKKKTYKADLMNNNAHLLMQKKQNKTKTKPKTNQNKIKSNRMSMRLLGGIWSIIRLSPLKPKKRETEIYQGIPFPSCFVSIKVLGYTL